MDIKSIYDYSDYRRFLKDYFFYLKEARKEFSQRYFAQKAGFSSHTYLGKIINGERSLSEDAIDKISSGFKFSGNIKKYFYALVKYNQATTPEDKQKWYSELITNKQCIEYHDLSKEHVNYYRNWYYPVIRHLAVYFDWNGDYGKLARLVDPPINATQARTAVEDLQKMGLLDIDKNFNVTSNIKGVKAHNLPEFVKIKARDEIVKKGYESLSRFNKDQRYTSCTLMSVSTENRKKIEKILVEAKEKVMRLVANDDRPENVVEMILQLFPMSKQVNK